MTQIEYESKLRLLTVIKANVRDGDIVFNSIIQSYASDYDDYAFESLERVADAMPVDRMVGMDFLMEALHTYLEGEPRIAAIESKIEMIEGILSVLTEELEMKAEARRAKKVEDACDEEEKLRQIIRMEAELESERENLMLMKEVMGDGDGYRLAKEILVYWAQHGDILAKVKYGGGGGR